MLLRILRLIIATCYHQELEDDHQELKDDHQELLIEVKDDRQNSCVIVLNFGLLLLFLHRVEEFTLELCSRLSTRYTR